MRGRLSALSCEFSYLFGALYAVPCALCAPLPATIEDSAFMTQQAIVLKLFEFVILVFALSFHEASHAWMASRLGDQTARMLGRVTLNPIKHIDPLGTVIIPLAMLFFPGFGRFLIGWAKPTPVTTRNFQNIKRDDILTTLAGPVSNLILAFASLIGLLILESTSAEGKLSVIAAVFTANHVQLPMEGALPAMFPIALLFYIGVWLNLMLAVFNMLPLPPLDGSHILRNVLPYNWVQYYDRLGMFSLILMVLVGGWVVNLFVSPALNVVNRMLLPSM
jgi:Zn-dependent protease